MIVVINANISNVLLKNNKSLGAVGFAVLVNFGYINLNNITI